MTESYTPIVSNNKNARNAQLFLAMLDRELERNDGWDVMSDCEHEQYIALNICKQLLMETRNFYMFKQRLTIPVFTKLVGHLLNNECLDVEEFIQAYLRQISNELTDDYSLAA